MILRYTLSSCPLGRLLLAAGDDGIRALLLGDGDQLLLTDLATRFPGEPLVQDDAGLAGWLEQVLTTFSTLSPVTLPLAPSGTPFQQRVWRALRDIPPGETRRYGELAGTLGSHARAVASACARNPIALLVPCHRVVGRDDRLTGYRWGLERKAALLALERDRR
ncbi:methylated-DNA--[protein]-cysteine S-methyltransferase [Stutzerimonas tarimensis]|uniref:Methylated-DNA--[protein]-cysteine S-methyltransferase n=1 Tax=Stutzerimonas tarimensis TaxID=1507735 RepID=A0ABV7T685_9GAMM